MVQDLLEEISDLKRTLGAVKAREADAKAALSMEATMINKRVKDLQVQLNDAREQQRELQRVRRALKLRTAELLDHERLAESKMALQQKVRRSGTCWTNYVAANVLIRVHRGESQNFAPVMVPGGSLLANGDARNGGPNGTRACTTDGACA